MRATRVLAAAVAVLLVASACQGRDRTGGTAGDPVRTLTLANPFDSPPPQLQGWVDALTKRSHGTLRIEFKNGWQQQQTDFEPKTIADVREGRADLGWVGARAFDRVGYTGFQPLLAPFLVDSYALEDRVFAEGIPDKMAAGLNGIGLVSLGVLPGPLLRVLSRDTAMTSPDAFLGKRLAVIDSQLNDATTKALGAMPVAVATGTDGTGPDISRLDGGFFQLAAVNGNNFQDDFHHYAVNVNLSPRPLVLISNAKVLNSLTDAERSTLQSAAGDSLRANVSTSRADDADAMSVLCKSGLKFDVATDTQRAALEKAVAPVVTALRKDATTSTWLEEIEELKGLVATPPETPACPGATPKQTTATLGIPDGTYARTLSQADIEAKGTKAFPLGAWKLVFDNGLLTKYGPDPSDVERYTYTTFRGRIIVKGSIPTMVATYTLDGDELRFSDLSFPGCSDCEFATDPNQCVNLKPGCPSFYLGSFDAFDKPWVRQR